MLDIAIIGGGISGLVVGYELQKKGLKVRVFEKKKVGGVIGIRELDGQRFSEGPVTVQYVGELPRLIKELDLSPIFADREFAKERFILKKGKLISLPLSQRAFLKTKLISTKGKLRAGLEFFIKKAQKEETTEEFITRRFGKEIVDYILDPFLAGTFAAEPSCLSAKYALSSLWQLEQSYGSILKAMKKSQSNTSQKMISPKLFSFNGGFTVLVESFKKYLDIEERNVLNVRQEESNVNVFLEDGESILAKKAVLAVDAQTTATLIQSQFESLSTLLSNVSYSSVAQIFLSLKNSSSLPKGFGVLIPKKEKRKILGVIFNKNIFPSEFEKNVCTCFVGGSRNEDLVVFSDEDLIKVAKKEVSNLINKNDELDASGAVVKWKKAIPRYEIGHGKILEAVHQMESTSRNIFFCGSWKNGISLPDTIKEAVKTSNKVKALWN